MRSHAGRFSALPRVGAGLLYRRRYLTDLVMRRKEIDFLEIVADHYLDETPEVLDELDLLNSNFRLIPHAINLSIGSADGVDGDYLERLARLIERIDPPWWSDHLAFTRIGDLQIGHLTPVPRSYEQIESIAANWERIQAVIDRPFLLENIASTIDVPGAEMSEGVFIAAVAERIDCGLLLDLTNLFANAYNHGWDAMTALGELPFDRVVQVHVAGGHYERNVLIDSHSRPVPGSVWSLLDRLTAQRVPQAIMIEREVNLPPLGELIAELDRVRAACRIRAA